MAAYYNEIDTNAAAWLRNLIREGLIAPGDVDERSIMEVAADDVRGYEQCHFFAGIGGWSHALRLAGVPDDARVWTGSCPCQPFSSAGQRRGTDDARHLWPRFRELIAECKPATVFGEQVASKDGRGWLAGVRADLEELGYAFGAADLCRAGVGAPRIRQRLFWLGLAAGERDRAPQVGGSDRQGEVAWRQLGVGGSGSPGWSEFEIIPCADERNRRIEPGSFPLADGIPTRKRDPRMGYLLAELAKLGYDAKTARQLLREARANRVGRLKGYGNAIVPQVAAEFIKAFLECLE